MRVRRIIVSDRIDLWFNNDGFRFTLANDKPYQLDKWEYWGYSWLPYRRDGIVKKVTSYLDGCSDHNKLDTWYQSLHF